MEQIREKFATQVDAALLQDIRSLAKEEGRQIQFIIEEALRNLLEERKQSKARPHVMAAYHASHVPFAPVYKKLAE